MSGIEGVDINPKVRGGRPCIPGHRVAIEDVLWELANGATIELVATKVYPHLTITQVRDAVISAWFVFAQEFDPATGLPKGRGE